MNSKSEGIETLSHQDNLSKLRNWIRRTQIRDALQQFDTALAEYETLMIWLVEGEKLDKAAAAVEKAKQYLSQILNASNVQGAATGNKFEDALNAKAIYTYFPELSIRDYLHKLMSEMWKKGEQFSGKYPLGNEDWDLRLIFSLIDCGLIPGVVTEDSDCEIDEWSFDQDQANQIVLELIHYCFYGQVNVE